MQEMALQLRGASTRMRSPLIWKGNSAGMRRGGGHQQCGEDVELLHDRLLSGL